MIPNWPRADQDYVREQIIQLRQAGVSPKAIAWEIMNMIPEGVDVADLVERTLEPMEATRLLPPEPEAPRKSIWEWVRSPAV
jgi:hypothetical protein